VSHGSPRIAADRDLRPAVLAAGAVLFVALAVSNSAGYRYGASDQAFYLPAAARAANPALFPRDAPLLDAQARLTLADNLVGGAVRVFSIELSTVALVGYIGGLLLLYAAALAFGLAVNGSRWAAAALAAALTLRHGISRAGVNTLEGYFHPRLIVFAGGILALAWFLRGRIWLALVLLLLIAPLHPTTGVWFFIWLGIAVMVANRHAPSALILTAAAAIVAGVWAVTAGPLSGRLVRMDPVWLAALEGKDYLFPNLWPPYAWLANLAYPVLIGGVAYARWRSGRLAPGERGLVAGACGLLLIFVGSLPFNAARLALIIQLQIPRIFWMLDFLATALIITWLTERARDRAYLVAAVLVAVAIARGAYIMTIEFPERPLFQANLRADEWRDAMNWAATTPVGSHWLAHPGHAHLYGSSVRLAAARDVFHEAVKDPAIAIYARPIAERVIERSQALPDFDRLDVAAAHALASRYELDYLITEARGLSLPVAYSNARFVVYRLR
jgi:hypothetical protein